MNELVKADAYTSSTLEHRMRYAQTLAAAPIIPKALRRGGPDGARETAANVLLVMETGSMLGIHPIAALQGIHVVEGKATLSAQLMNAQVRKAGHKLEVITSGKVVRDDKGKIARASDYSVTAKLTRGDDGTTHESTWTYERAERAKLLGKDNWTNYFEGMASSRAISEVCRQGAPDALMGVVYTPEELGASVNSDGEIIDMPEVSAVPERERSQPPVTDSEQAEGEEHPAKVAWREKIAAAADVEALREVYREAGRAGILALVIDDEKIQTVEQVILARVELLSGPSSDESSEGEENVVDAEIVTESDAQGDDEGRAAVLDGNDA